MADPRLRVVLGSVYPYDEARIRGGVEAVAAYLVPALAARPELDLHVVSCSRAVKRSGRERRGNVTFHWLATGSRLNGVKAATSNAWRVARVYARLQPDVVHAQNFSEYAMAGTNGAPLLLTVHGLEALAPAMRGVGQYGGLVGSYRRWIGRRSAEEGLRRADAIISIAGDYLAAALGGRIGARPLYHIANPVAEAFWSVPAEPAAGGVILCVGDLMARKGALELVRAFGQLAPRLPEARLEFAGGVGEAAYAQAVQAETARLGLSERVRFLGRLDQRQLLEAYARASVIALPSLQETAPMALAQAMAAGRPVVATRVGGVPWLLGDERAGRLVDPGDSAGLAAALEALLANPAQRRALGAAGRRQASTRFSAAAIAEQTVAVYRALAARPMRAKAS